LLQLHQEDAGLRGRVVAVKHYVYSELFAVGNLDFQSDLNAVLDPGELEHIADSGEATAPGVALTDGGLVPERLDIGVVEGFE
jgi:hypothetical protein